MHSITGSNRRKTRQWNDTYTVGIEEIDAQHRGLLDLINEIGDLADAQDEVKSAAFLALNAMIRYAQNHFRTEEGYLEKYSYPAYPEQKAEHEVFVETGFSMVQQLEEKVFTFGAIKLYLEDWYADHILGTDQGYKRFLSNKMAEEAKIASAETNDKAAG
jgi:hemerythrin-like metal-binding protein